MASSASERRSPGLLAAGAAASGPPVAAACLTVPGAAAARISAGTASSPMLVADGARSPASTRIARRVAVSCRKFPGHGCEASARRASSSSGGAGPSAWAHNVATMSARDSTGSARSAGSVTRYCASR